MLYNINLFLITYNIKEFLENSLQYILSLLSLYGQCFNTSAHELRTVMDYANVFLESSLYTFNIVDV